MREGRGLAYPRARLVPDLLPPYFKRWRPGSVRLNECKPPEISSQPRSFT